MDEGGISGLVRERFESALIPDERFAEAYAEVPDQRRALLKTCIARLWEWFGPCRASEELVVRRWRQGFVSRTSKRPRAACAVFFTPSVGPAALLAALVPARALGVGEVLAVCCGGEPPAAPVLTALELAGVEDALLLSAELSAHLASLLAGTECSNVVLGEALDGSSRSCSSWRAPHPRSVGVWLDGTPGAGPDPDLDALAFAHSDAGLLVMGESEQPPLSGAALPVNARYVSGTFDDFLAIGFHGVVVPQGRLVAASEHQGLTLAAGQEGCWLHAGLTADHFRIKRHAWGGPGGPQDNGAI
ncbi:MAG: hypothetical protein AB7D51_08280 [Desulfovibrionaceae bacterium]